MRLLFTGSALIFVVYLSGCASEQPWLNAVSDGAQRAAAGKIIERSFTEPMTALAQEALSGNYRDKLAYAGALKMGRLPDETGVSLSIVPELHDEFPELKVEPFRTISTNERYHLMEWSNAVAKEIYAHVGHDVIYSYDPVPAEMKNLFDRYVLSETNRCMSSIVETYVKNISVRAAYNEFSKSEGKRKDIANSLYIDFRATTAVGNLTWFECEGNIEKYLYLYKKLNPNLEKKIESIINEEVDKELKVID